MLVMSSAALTAASPQHTNARSYEIRVGMSVYWITVAEMPPEPGVAGIWYRWEGGGAVGTAKTRGHCIEDARATFAAREREETISVGLEPVLSVLRGAL